MLTTVWLVVQIAIAGATPFVVEEAQYPSIEACATRAAEILNGAAQVTGDDGFEIAAICSLEKFPQRPAAMPPSD